MDDTNNNLGELIRSKLITDNNIIAEFMSELNVIMPEKIYFNPERLSIPTHNNNYYHYCMETLQSYILNDTDFIT